MIARHLLPRLRTADLPGTASLTPTSSTERRCRPAARAVSRAELLSLLCLLGLANVLAADVLIALGSEQPAQALAERFDIVTLAALVVGIGFLRQLPDAPLRRSDWAVAALIVPLLLVPHRAASWLALSGLGLYLTCRDRRSVPAVAAGSIFLALTASSFWAQIAIHTFSPPLLALDAALTAATLGLIQGAPVERVGNLIASSEQTTLLVLAGCASLPNLCHGLLWCITIARRLRPAWRPADLVALLAVAGLVLIANTLRLALMGLGADSYRWVHGPVGGNVFNVGLLVAIAAVAYCSAAAAAPSGRR